MTSFFVYFFIDLVYNLKKEVIKMRDGKIILKKKKVRHKILFFILFLAILFLIGYQIGIYCSKQSLSSVTVYDLLKRIP